MWSQCSAYVELYLLGEHALCCGGLTTSLDTNSLCIHLMLQVMFEAAPKIASHGIMQSSLELKMVSLRFCNIKTTELGKHDILCNTNSTQLLAAYCIAVGTVLTS